MYNQHISIRVYILLLVLTVVIAGCGTTATTASPPQTALAPTVTSIPLQLNPKLASEINNIRTYEILSINPAPFGRILDPAKTKGFIFLHRYPTASGGVFKRCGIKLKT